MLVFSIFSFFNKRHSQSCLIPELCGKALTLYSIDTHFDASTTAFENVAGKGEIALNEQFLLFPQCFILNQIIIYQFVHIFCIISLFAAELQEPKIGISGRGLSPHSLTHSHTMTPFDAPGKQAF